MRVSEVEARLHEMLRAAGVDPIDPTLPETWDVFRTFLDEPVDTESDGVLVQGGVSSFRGPEEYYFDFLRQVREPGEDEFVQLHCEFRYGPTAELRAFRTFSEWWFPDYPQDLDDFLTGIRARPDFAAVAALKPAAASIHTEET